MKYFFILAVSSVIFFSCSSEKKVSTGVVVVNEKDLEKIISNRNGKTLFLNVWATWCAPCVEEFPAIVKLNNKYSGNDFEVVALSVDLPSERESKIIPFLKEQGASFKVIVAEEKSSSNIIDLLDPEWSGAVPVTFLFDKSGKQQIILTGAHSYEQMAAAADSVISL